MAKMQYGRHKKGLVPITIWEESGFKERLKREAQASGLPHWSLSDQIRYELRDRRGLWEEPYRPTSEKAPGKK